MKVYILRDPRDNSVKYVGVTGMDIRKRGYRHITSRKQDTPRGRWIQALHEEGLKPVAEQIDEVPDDQWPGAERRWIDHYRSLGCGLVNDTTGGPGFTRRHSEQTKRLISNQRKGIATVRADHAAWCQAISNAMAGKAKSPSHREKLAAALRGRSKLTPEQQERARQMRADGTSIRQIGLALGVGWDAVNRILTR